MGTIHAVQLKRICSLGIDLDYVGILPTYTKRWYRLGGRLDWSYPSSPTAWSRKYLPDGSSKSSISAGLDKPDGELGTRTDGAVSAWPASAQPSVRRGRRCKVWPARRFPRAEGGGHRGQCRCPRHRFAYVLRSSWLGWSFTPMSRGVQNRQYVLVNGVLVGPVRHGVPTERARRPGPGPTLLQRCNTARLRCPQAR
jgi:hypothetical protein